ncbi:hypothetical protein [Sulfurimonas sp.]|uniref:hypothetical protein n=1 Tax=Sulfurimonas sp. TaxID=2022749 RepID=UPI002614AC77|nr:hypothetical protein [Sulfurimonas sp.]
MLKKIIVFVALVATSFVQAKTIKNCEPAIVDVRLPNVIDSNMTLSASKVYGIDRKVIVNNGATLTIEPGTTLAGCSLYSFLAIANDAKIIAKGTKHKPIIFTSQLDLLGFSSPRNSLGEWGGLVIAGRAYTHYKENKYEADESITFGSQSHEYDEDSSGILEYVVIKYTGYEVKKDKELNGLSLAGVGSGTVIKNIAIIGGADDGIEIWGGSVNIDGLYVYNAKDDSVDVDLGYRGEIKNVLVVQNKVSKTNNHDSSAMEFGNDENLIKTGEKTATLPTIKNLTAYIKGGGIYNKYDAGFRLKNVKILSEKKENCEMVHFRGKDSYTTGAKFLDGDLCLYDKAKPLKIKELFSKKNSKTPKKSYTAYDFFIKNNLVKGNGKIISCKDQYKGVNEKVVWKGKRGSNEPLAQSMKPELFSQHR